MPVISTTEMLKRRNFKFKIGLCYVVKDCLKRGGNGDFWVSDIERTILWGHCRYQVPGYFPHHSLTHTLLLHTHTHPSVYASSALSPFSPYLAFELLNLLVKQILCVLLPNYAYSCVQISFWVLFSQIPLAVTPMSFSLFTSMSSPPVIMCANA